MRKIKVVVLLVQQLQHGFTKNAKVSPNLTVAHVYMRTGTQLRALSCRTQRYRKSFVPNSIHVTNNP